MKQVVVFLLRSLFLVSGCQTTHQERPPNDEWITKITGSYKGYVFSSGSYCPAKTVIIRDTGGNLRGEYQFYENGVTLFGTLYSFRNSGPYTIQCRWRDKYGTGNLKIVFDEKFEKFDGYWNPEGSENAASWSGSKL